MAKKAYSIQEVERPYFDDLLTLLGNFHTELAFCTSVGVLICESGIEFILMEVDILAEGSASGFTIGKFYNRCTRFHDLLAKVMAMKLYEKFLHTISQEELKTYQAMQVSPTDLSPVDTHLKDQAILQHLA